jgi:hypothetical protein
MMLFAIPAFLGIELPEAEVGRCSWATIIFYYYLKFKKFSLANTKYVTFLGITFGVCFSFAFLVVTSLWIFKIWVFLLILILHILC